TTIYAELHSAAVSEFNINERIQLNSATIHAEPHLITISGFDINEQMQYNSVTICAEPHSATVLSEFDRDLLGKFRTKMNKIKYVFCSVYNENFLSITIVKGKCCQCYTEKSTPKKFSGENDMDPGKVPEELQGLTEVKEMLITQVFPLFIIGCVNYMVPVCKISII
ncbi:27709_t:CDS:2, partial [Gigaspora margarita]